MRLRALARLAAIFTLLMPPHTVKQCALPAFCWLTSQHLIAERKKRANLISWEEPEDGGVERCQWLRSSRSAHTHDDNPHPVPANYYNTISSSAFLSTARSRSPPPPWSSSLSVHTHTEHILVFLPDCAWFICLCVFAHNASAWLHLHMCAFTGAHDYMNYVSVGGGGGVTTFGCSMYVELISHFHICGATISACERDHVFVSGEGNEDTHLAMWRFPRNLKCWRHSLKGMQKYLGWRVKVLLVFKRFVS